MNDCKPEADLAGSAVPLRYNSPPSLLRLYPHIFLDRRPRLVPHGTYYKPIEGCLERPSADATSLSDYRQICGFNDDGNLPITYPHVLATPLHLAMLASRSFPVRVPGLVHVRNSICQYRRIADDMRPPIHARLDAHRDTRRGQEFDLITEISVDGKPCWREVMTFLARRARNRSASTDKASSDRSNRSPGKGTVVATIATGPDLGRRYARIAGDYNPIHLSRLTAGLFGFPAPIAHGMWSLGRCCAEFREVIQEEIVDISCNFKQPVLLPGRLELRKAPVVDRMVFELSDATDGRLHLFGTIRPGVPAVTGI